MKDRLPRADRDAAHADQERPHPDDIRQELGRIINSSPFRDAYRLTSFLSFIVEMTLAGNASKLKAYTIAVEALGRGADFDPQTDPIVRVEAVRMRQALARYYSGIGRDDPLVIEVPRGSYVPAFRRPNACERPRPRAAASLPALLKAEQEQSAEIASRRQELSQSIRRFRELANAHRQQVAAMAAAVGQARQTLADSRALLQACRGSTLLAALIGRCYQPRSPINRMKSGPRMAEKRKDNKLKARLPRGFEDRGPIEIAATRRMIETIRQVYERYGFEPVETPAIEYTDALGKFLPDQDRPNEGVLSFQDDDEQWLSLRYDLTAPLARYVAENFDTLPKPYRSYRFGFVFRNEKPGPGRFRQFMQFDADTVGSASPAADAEMCMMAADTMEALGIPRGDYVVKVNNRKVLDGVLDSLDLGGDVNFGRRLTVLRAIDKVDRLGFDGVAALLGPGRKDESGDFTKGAGLDDVAITRILNFTGWGEKGSGAKSTISANEVTIANFEDAVQDSALGQSGVAELAEIKALVAAAGYDDGRIVIDPSVVRGLEYYTGTVFEVGLNFQTDGADGSPQFGSPAGGGRYDRLVARFRGEPVPATGISIGVSRLAAVLQYLGKLDEKPEPGPVVVTVFDKDRLADYQNMVATLRAANIRAELYLGNPRNLGNQLKYADKRNAPCVVIQGSDEKAKGEVTIKDLIIGAELAKLEKGRDEHLQKQAEAQRSVPEAELVATVRNILARHGIS